MLSLVDRTRDSRSTTRDDMSYNYESSSRMNRRDFYRKNFLLRFFFNLTLVFDYTYSRSQRQPTRNVCPALELDFWPDAVKTVTTCRQYPSRCTGRPTGASQTSTRPSPNRSRAIRKHGHGVFECHERFQIEPLPKLFNCAASSRTTVHTFSHAF